MREICIESEFVYLIIVIVNSEVSNIGKVGYWAKHYGDSVSFSGRPTYMCVSIILKDL